MKKSTLFLFAATVTAAMTVACFNLGITSPLDSTARPPASGSIWQGTAQNANCAWVVDEQGNYGCTGKDGKAVGSKTGKACASSILGLIQTGDMSLAAAAKNGGISKVNSVDISRKALLVSLWSQHCLHVNGE